jgi:hypothetical protein
MELCNNIKWCNTLKNAETTPGQYTIPTNTVKESVTPNHNFLSKVNKCFGTVCITTFNKLHYDNIFIHHYETVLTFKTVIRLQGSCFLAHWGYSFCHWLINIKFYFNIPAVIRNPRKIFQNKMSYFSTKNNSFRLSR